MTNGSFKKSKRKLKDTRRQMTIIQNLWDTAKAVLRGKFIAIQSYLRKEEKNANKQLTLHLKHLKKEEQRSKSVKGKKS